MNYNDYVAQIANLAVVPVNDPNYQLLIPQMIQYAELRMQRDFDFLSTQVQDTTYSLTANSNLLTLPTSSFVVLQTIQIVDSTGLALPLLPVSKEFLQNTWGLGSATGIPMYFAVTGGDEASTGEISQNVLVGPIPNINFNLIITGTMRTAPLSPYDNPTTFISVYMPDLFIMASMIFISAYQRNFGRQSDDPAMAQSYESQYQALKASAMVEEYRKKFQSSAWSSMSPAPTATPSR
jgi:hypothetical protein